MGKEPEHSPHRGTELLFAPNLKMDAMNGIVSELTQFAEEKLQGLSTLADMHQEWLRNAVGEVHRLLEARDSAKREPLAEAEPAVKVRIVVRGGLVGLLGRAGCWRLWSASGGVDRILARI